MKLVSGVPLDEGQRARLHEIVPKLEIADSAQLPGLSGVLRW